MPLSPSVKITAQALLLAGLFAGLYVWHFGWQSPYRFELEWDEEVQLHDSRLMQVHIKRSYESRSLFSRRDAVRLETDISFNAGPPLGLFRQRFAPDDVALIDQLNQVWYIATTPSAMAVGRKPDPSSPPFWTFGPGQPVQQAGAADKLPAAFTRWNVMPDTAGPEGLAPFHQTLLKLDDKMRHWAAHPRPNGEDTIRLRPRS